MATKPDPEIELALRSVAEGPLDEGRKRVFTDLLLERGDPRGEFMLLQFVIAANQASGAVRQRAHELWQRHKREWTKELEGAVTDLELENGFPVAGTVGKASDPAKIVGSAMFVTLKRLRATADGGALLLAAACDPRLTGLDTLEIAAADTFRDIAEKGVPGRLRSVTLRFPLEPRDLERLLTSLAFSRLRALTFHQRTERSARRTLASRLSDVFAGGKNDRSALTASLTRLDTHATLEVVELPGSGFGDLAAFTQIAAVWPRLELRRIGATGTCELERDEQGTLLVLQNFTVLQLLQLRPLVPQDVTRARLSRKRQRGGEDLELLIKAWAPIAVTMV